MLAVSLVDFQASPMSAINHDVMPRQNLLKLISKLCRIPLFGQLSVTSSRFCQVGCLDEPAPQSTVRNGHL